MRTFSFHPLIGAIVLSLLAMGVIGVFIVLPTACINLTWNLVVAHYTPLPAIGPWQAWLLYLASACVAYLLGFVQIEFKAETLE